MIQGSAVAAALVSLAFTASAAATPPSPTITEPSTDGQLVHPADVHMEVALPEDEDEDVCTDWEIRTYATGLLNFPPTLLIGADGEVRDLMLESTGIPVKVDDNSSTSFYANDSVEGSTSPCSSEPLAYLESTPAGAQAKGFNLRAAKRRCRNKFTGKARARCIKKAKRRARALGV